MTVDEAFADMARAQMAMMSAICALIRAHPNRDLVETALNELHTTFGTAARSPSTPATNAVLDALDLAFQDRLRRP